MASSTWFFSRFHFQPIFVRKPRYFPRWVRTTSPQKHVYPEPILAFAASGELREKLSRYIDTFGEDPDSVVQVCTQGSLELRQLELAEVILSLQNDFIGKSITMLFLLKSMKHVDCQIFGEFLHEEYGGPETLLVDPFTDMLVALKENNLPGATLAARASILWAQTFFDRDWDIWNTRRSG